MDSFKHFFSHLWGSKRILIEKWSEFDFSRITSGQAYGFTNWFLNPLFQDENIYSSQPLMDIKAIKFDCFMTQTWYSLFNASSKMHFTFLRRQTYLQCSFTHINLIISTKPLEWNKSQGTVYKKVWLLNWPSTQFYFMSSFSTTHLSRESHQEPCKNKNKSL